MESATQVFTALSFLVIGLSHIFQPRVWIAYFQAKLAQGARGAFSEGFLALTFGGIIAGFHNVWQGPGVVLTLIGWGQVAKGFVRFLAPQMSLRLMESVAHDDPRSVRSFRLGGVFALLLSGYVWWLRFRA
jgi:hypothetical protein